MYDFCLIDTKNGYFTFKTTIFGNKYIGDDKLIIFVKND